MTTPAQTAHLDPRFPRARILTAGGPLLDYLAATDLRGGAWTAMSDPDLGQVAGTVPPLQAATLTGHVATIAEHSIYATLAEEHEQHVAFADLSGQAVPAGVAGWLARPYTEAAASAGWDQFTVNEDHVARWREAGATVGAVLGTLLVEHLTCFHLSLEDLEWPLGEAADSRRLVSPVVELLTSWAIARDLDPDVVWLWAVDPNLFAEDHGIAAVFHPDFAHPVAWYGNHGVDY